MLIAALLPGCAQPVDNLEDSSGLSGEGGWAEFVVNHRKALLEQRKTYHLCSWLEKNAEPLYQICRHGSHFELAAPDDASQCRAVLDLEQRNGTLYAGAIRPCEHETASRTASLSESLGAGVSATPVLDDNIDPDAAGSTFLRIDYDGSHAGSVVSSELEFAYYVVDPQNGHRRLATMIRDENVTPRYLRIHVAPNAPSAINGVTLGLIGHAMLPAVAADRARLRRIQEEER